MDLDSAKENIQPLATGRNIQRLEAALNTESHDTILNQRYEFENAIQNYTGDDPLSGWYEYIEWVEQSFPKSGKESALDELIEKCLVEFEREEKYKQDPRMIRLYIKYIDSQPNQQEHFQSLYNQGVGTMVADLYICWAYYYDIANKFERANAVYRMGLDARAEPFDQLVQAHQQFGFSMSQRLLNQDDNFNKDFLTTMEERRSALTSLRRHRHKHVGSIRTGRAIKSHEPGQIQQHGSNLASSSNSKIKVYEQNSVNDHQFRHPADVTTIPPPTSVVQTIMDSSKKQENIREPGPWANAKKSSTSSTTNKVFANANVTAFPIMVDMDVTCTPLSPIPLPVNMHAIGIIQPYQSTLPPKNLPFPNDFVVPYFIEEEIPAGTVAAYDKIMLFPKPTKSFNIEELSAYKWYKKNRITNKFTTEQDKLWQNVFEVGIRLPPQFSPKNEPQDEFLVDRFIEDELNLCPNRKFCFKHAQFYLPSVIHEYSNEELLRTKWQNGQMSSQLKEAPSPISDSMDETVMIKGRQSISHGAIRKSIAPGGRKSIMPITDDSSYKRKSMLPSKIRSNNEIKMNNELKIGDETPKSSLLENKSVIPCFLPAKVSAIVEDTPKSVSFNVRNDFLTPAAPKRVLSIFAKKPSSLALPMMHTEEQQDKTPEIIQKVLYAVHGEPEQSPIFAEKSVTIDSVLKASKFNETMMSKEESPEIGSEKSLRNITETPISTLATPGFVKSTTVILPTQGFVKSTGVLRKSICPSKRKIESPDLELPSKSMCLSLVDEPQLTPQIQTPVEVRESVPASAFTIFEDPDNLSPEKSTMDAVVFKTPHQIRTSRKSLAPVGQPEEFEETFSTQNFNFFIKSQSVSTPKAANPAKSVLQHIEPTISEKCEPAITPTTTPKLISPNCMTAMPAQLSTILEITETNTLSSATASTKSTIDTQYTSSPETESEITTDKSHQLAKSMPSNLTQPAVGHSNGQLSLRSKLSLTEPMMEDNGILPEIIDLKISTEPAEVRPQLIAPFQIYEDRTETAQPIQLPSSDIPSMCPIPACEDRTETVLIMNCTKPMECSAKANIYETTLPPPPDFNETQANFTEPIVPAYESSIQKLSTDATLSLMCPIPIYEDHTETIPILLNITQKIDNSMQIPSISPIKIYEDQTETLEAIDLKKIEATQRNVDFVPAFSAIRIIGDESGDHTLLPRKSTIENYEPVTVPHRQNTSHLKQPFGVLMSTAKPVAIESSYKHEEEELFEMFQQTPVKPMGISRIPIAKSIKVTSFEDFLQPTSVIDTTGSSLLEPMVLRMDVTKDTQLFRQPHAVSSSISQNQVNISDDIRTEQFDIHLDAIANSTIRQKGVGASEKIATDKEFSRIEQQSLHIKDEQFSEIGVERLTISKPLAARLGELSVSFSEEDLRKIDITETMENSIYVAKRVSLDEQGEKERWSEAPDNFDEATIYDGKYLRHSVDLNETEQIIEEHIDNNSDPFDPKVQQAFLEKHDLMGYVERDVDSCQMVNTLRQLRVNMTVELNKRKFCVTSLIGKGAYGSVFSGKCVKTGLTYAMKQERPANLWEYYICLEIQSRIEFDYILPAFMKVECSIIANNASLLVSELSPYGSILDVCNKIKAKSTKNCPPSVVMILATQMLSIVDHLHACSIIHADIKPDNWLLMRRLNVDPTVIVLKLIDFGQSIDLQLYPKGQKFYTKLNTKNFICTEMLDGKPWTFQTDLFCLASTVHACLFGQYMEVARPSTKSSQYHITTNIPRYYPKAMWTTFFETLINIKDCNSMPNLQTLRTLLLKEIMDVKEAQNNVNAVNDIIQAGI